MCLPSSAPKPALRFALFYHFTPFCPALDCASLHGHNQSLPQRLPGLAKTQCAAMFAQLDVLVTIPIDKRRCFTHRFSPTGFILNASDPNCCRPIALARIQVKTYPFSSILCKIKSITDAKPRMFSFAQRIESPLLLSFDCVRDAGDP